MTTHVHKITTIDNEERLVHCSSVLAEDAIKTYRNSVFYSGLIHENMRKIKTVAYCGVLVNAPCTFF